MHSKSIFVILPLALCIAAAGCGPTDKPQLPIPDAPKEWTLPSAGEAATVGWIHSFNDSTLTRLVQEAQSHNKDLQAAAAVVIKARALAKQAGAALTPSVDLSAGATRGDSDSAQLSLGAQANWEVDLWGRIAAGEQAAQASAQAAAADYEYARHSLAAATAKAYFAAIESELQQQAADKTAAALEKTIRIVKVQHDNGLATGQDLALARSDLAVARERQAAISGSRRDALRALELLLGRYPQAALDVRRTLPETPPPPPAGVPSAILERRPDIIAAERRVAAAFGALQEAKAARLPSINLTGNLGASSNSLSNLLNPADLAWTLGAALIAPLIDGGARQAQIEIADAEQQQAIAAYGQAALTAFGEVEKILDSGAVLTRRRTELEIAAAEIHKAHHLADLRHRAGEGELLDVLSIQQRVFSADSNLASVRRAMLEQRVNLHLALGGEWDN